MSGHNPTFRYPSHRLVVHTFRYQYQIPSTYTTKIFQSHRKQKTGFKWAGQLITQICIIIYGQWLRRSKIKHAVEALDEHSTEFIINAKIID